MDLPKEDAPSLEEEDSPNPRRDSSLLVVPVEITPQIAATFTENFPISQTTPIVGPHLTPTLPD